MASLFQTVMTFESRSVGKSWFYIVARKTFACMTSRCCSYVFAVVVVDQENQSNLLKFLINGTDWPAYDAFVKMAYWR